MTDKILSLVESSQRGDTVALDKLIYEHKNYIQKTTSQICKRNVNWNQDDELSIALIAFHEAVQKYDPNKGAHFLTFARNVIRQRLIDFFRKEERHLHLPLEASSDIGEERQITQIEANKAMEEFQSLQEQNEVALILEEFEQRLLQFGISLDDLVDASPKHRDTRENLLRISKILSNDKELLQTLNELKRLPVTALVKKAKVSRRVLEKGRKYIIALTVIITDEKFSNLKSFAGI